jgi:hypothetical protein
MTSLPDPRRRATTWIVIGAVAVLAIVATLLAFGLLSNLQTGAGPSASPSAGGSAEVSVGASVLSEPSAIASVSASSTPVEGGPESWTATGNMIQARTNHTATLLLDGKVLVAGGGTRDGGLITATAELYDPATGTWTATGSMAEARWSHTATLLPNGTVLVTGGFASSSGFATLASAEVYDPRTGTWAATGSMSGTRAIHTATRLSNGRVLVAGGTSGEISYLEDYVPLASAELYDPSAGSWSATGSMIEAGRGPATLLTNGKVLVVAHPELYDPLSGSWAATGSMVEGRGSSTSTLLPDGTVLAAGGYRGPAIFNSAELYDPRTGSWTTAGEMTEYRTGHTATLLPNGFVLIAGGAVPAASAELYDPSTTSWNATVSMIEARYLHTATLLDDGRVLIAGGSTNGVGALASAELYDPGARS